MAILFFQNEAIFSPREAYPPMKISCKFGEPSWCSFPLRVLTPKISLRTAAAALRTLNQSIHRMPPVDTINIQAGDNKRRFVYQKIYVLLQMSGTIMFTIKLLCNLLLLHYCFTEDECKISIYDNMTNFLHTRSLKSSSFTSSTF